MLHHNRFKRKISSALSAVNEYGSKEMKIDAYGIVFSDDNSGIPDLLLGDETMGNCSNG
jgi:hypothetical protein